MGIIVWLFIAAMVGWIASMIMGTNAQQGVILNIVVGIVGAMIGGWLIGPMLGAAAGGVAAGALAGTVVGPVGTVVGAAVGAVVGGLAGKGVAEGIDPTIEDAYWRENYSSRPYVKSGEDFDDFGPAYRFGVVSYGRSDGSSFDQSESVLRRDWDKNRGDSNLSWDRAKDASRDSWQRASDSIERAVPGDSDHDGK